jgi:hypothetical protein
MKTLWRENQENSSDRISHAWAPLNYTVIIINLPVGSSNISEDHRNRHKSSRELRQEASKGVRAGIRDFRNVQLDTQVRKDTVVRRIAPKCFIIYFSKKEFRPTLKLSKKK